MLLTGSENALADDAIRLAGRLQRRQMFLRRRIARIGRILYHVHQRAELLVQAREKMENLEESSGLSRDRIKKQLENKLGRLDDVALIKELEEKRTAMMSDISEELQKRKEAMAGKVSHNMQRFVKAYPNLNRGYKLHKKYGFGRKNKDAE